MPKRGWRLVCSSLHRFRTINPCQARPITQWVQILWLPTLVAFRSSSHHLRLQFRGWKWIIAPRGTFSSYNIRHLGYVYLIWTVLALLMYHSLTKHVEANSVANAVSDVVCDHGEAHENDKSIESWSVINAICVILYGASHVTRMQIVDGEA